MELQETLAGIVQSCPGQMGLAVHHLERGERITFAGDELFPLASVFKVPVLVELFRQVEQDRLRLSDAVVLQESDKSPGSGVLKEMQPGLRLTIKDLAMLMTIISDNTATDMLLERLGGPESVQEGLRAYDIDGISVVFDCKTLLLLAAGLDGADRRRENLDLAADRLRHNDYDLSSPAFAKDLKINNVSTPTALSALFTKLQRNQLLSPEASGGVLDILSRQQLSDRLPFFLPRSLRFAHKTGTVATTRNDAGILTLENGESIVICALVRDAPVEAAREVDDAMGRVAKAVCDTYQSRA